MVSIPAAEEDRAQRRPSGWLRPAIRLAIGVGVILFLISRSDITAIKRALAGGDPVLIMTGYMLNVALLVTSAFRWRIFLIALDVDLPIPSTLRLTFVGAFFNAFLPTGVGGDAYKAFRVRTRNTNLARSFASVLLDRLAGIAMLAILAVVAAMTATLSDITPLVLISLALAVGVLAAATFVLMMGQSLLGRGASTWFGIRPRIRRALDAAASAMRRRSTIRRSFFVGLVAQGLAIAAHAALAQGLGLGVPLDIVTLGLFIATVASAIPITINGLGVREAVWVWGLSLYGVAEPRALAYGLLILGVSLGTSAVGGLVYAFAGGEVSVEEGT